MRYLISKATVFCCLPAMLLPCSALAQLEEIVVTAQKREESLMDIPMAVSAFTDAELNRIGVSDIRDLADDIPTLHTSDNFQGQVTVTLRGVETISPTDPAVAYHVDGIYVPRETSVLALIHDIERMEVLRGPQGTLYGRNATAGAINIVNRKPGDELSAGLDIGFGNFSHKNFKGHVNLPVTDSFKLRGSFAVERRDGFNTTEGSRDMFTGQAFSIPDDENFWNSDKESVRISALFEPNDRFSWYVSGEYFNNESPPPINKQIRPQDTNPDPRNSAVSTVPVFKQEIFTVRSRIDWDITDAVRLSYIAGWGSEEMPERSRVSPLVQVPAILSNSTADIEYYNHELQLQSTGNSAFQWMVGAFIFRDNSDSALDFALGIPPPPSGPPPGGAFFGFRNETNGEDTQSYAIFSHNTYAITEDLRLTAGLRFTHDRKKINDFNRTFFGGQPGPGMPPMFASSLEELRNTVTAMLPSTRDKAIWNDLSWKVGLDWNVTPNHMLYAQASTGFKSGGFNIAVGEGFSFNEENLLSVEVGGKGSFLEERLNLSTTFFYYDYSDFQGNEVIQDPNSPGLLSITTNAAAASIKGVELEFVWAVTENSRLQGFGAWLDATFDSFPNAPADAANSPPPGATVDLSGNRLSKTPKWEFNVTYLHTFHLPVGGSLQPRLSWKWRDDHFLRIFNDPAIDRVESVGVLDASMRYDSPDGNWYIEGYGKNITDKDFPITSASGLPGTANLLFNPPRTYGVRLGYNWEG